MDISEQVLISTLAQLLRKALLRWVKGKKNKHVRNCKSENPAAAEKLMFFIV
jgi:hypothetical protein